MRSIAMMAVAAMAASGSVQAQNLTEGLSPPASGPSLALSLEAAQATIAACAPKGYRLAVTVLDSAGIPKLVLVDDGVSARSVDSSMNKATTAIRLKMSTASAIEKAKTDPELAARIAADKSLFVHAGAVLLIADGTTLGAIAASGAPLKGEDDICIAAGVEKIKERLK